MAALACTLALAGLPAYAGDSPMFRGDPSHSGVCEGDGSPRFTQVRWEFATHGPIFSTPAIAGGAVYFGSADGNLYALDAMTGRPRWQFATGARVTSSPAVDGGLVYFESYDGFLYAVDAATGKERWKFATGGEHRFTATHLHGALPVAERMPDPFDVFLSSPCVASGVVYFGSGDGNVYALDAASGALRWKFATGDVVHASPAVVAGTVYIGSWDSWFYALDAASGALRWRFQTGVDPDIHNQVGISSSATVVDGTVYFGCRDGHLYALDAATGAKRWDFSTQRAWVTASPLVRGGEVWFGAGSSREFLAVDATTGREKLRMPLQRGVFGSAISCGDLVLFGGIDGQLTGLDAATHRVVFTWQDARAKRANAQYVARVMRAQPDTLSTDELLYDRMVERFNRMLTGSLFGSPVVAGDLLYVGDTDGRLYALAAGRR